MALVAFISGCGFEPLYVEKKTSSDWYYNNEFDAGIRDEMASVKVELIQDRIGQLIRNDLLDKLTPKGEPKSPKYYLKVTNVKKEEIDQANKQMIQYKESLIKKIWNKIINFLRRNKYE